MKKSDIAIVGGGFSGIYSAWRLAKAGAQVTLFESSERLGGASMNSRQWRGHWLDNGAHNFDIRAQKGYEFFSDILNTDLHIIEDHTWASAFGEQWTLGIESADLSCNSRETAQLALDQMQQLYKASSDSRNRSNLAAGQRTPISVQFSPEIPLSQWYTENYGDVLSETITPMILKASGSDASKMSADAINTLGFFKRVKLGEDHEMIDLKSSSNFWDERLAVTTACSDERYLGLNNNASFGYPAKKGLAGFGYNSLRRLKELGVNVCTSEAVIGLKNTASTIEVQTGKQRLVTKKLLWTLPDHMLAELIELKTKIRQYQLPIGFSLYAFEVPRQCVAGPDYLHDFSQDTLTFRYSHPSRYSNNYTYDDFGYVLAEVPTHPRNMAALQTEDVKARVWQDLLASGYLIENSHYRNSVYWPLMVGFSVPRPGFSKIYNEYLQALEAQLPNLHTIAPGIRGRSAFVAAYENKLQQQLS